MKNEQSGKIDHTQWLKKLYRYCMGFSIGFFISGSIVVGIYYLKYEPFVEDIRESCTEVRTKLRRRPNPDSYILKIVNYNLDGINHGLDLFDEIPLDLNLITFGASLSFLGIALEIRKNLK